MDVGPPPASKLINAHDQAVVRVLSVFRAACSGGTSCSSSCKVPEAQPPPLDEVKLELAVRACLEELVQTYELESDDRLQQELSRERDLQKWRFALRQQRAALVEQHNAEPVGGEEQSSNPLAAAVPGPEELARERDLQERERQVALDSRANEEKRMDLEVLEDRLNQQGERLKMLTQREALVSDRELRVQECSRDLEDRLRQHDHGVRRQNEACSKAECELAAKEASLSERECEMERREHAQEEASRQARQITFDAERKLSEREAALAQTERTLEQDQQSYERRARELADAETAVQHRLEEVARRERSLAEERERAASLAEREQRVLHDLETREAALAQREQASRHELAATAASAQEIEQREADLAQREEVLVRLEQREAGLVQHEEEQRQRFDAWERRLVEQGRSLAAERDAVSAAAAQRVEQEGGRASSLEVREARVAEVERNLAERERSHREKERQLEEKSLQLEAAEERCRRLAEDHERELADLRQHAAEEPQELAACPRGAGSAPGSAVGSRRTSACSGQPRPGMARRGSTASTQPQKQEPGSRRTSATSGQPRRQEGPNSAGPSGAQRQRLTARKRVGQGRGGGIAPLLGSKAAEVPSDGEAEQSVDHGLQPPTPVPLPSLSSLHGCVGSPSKRRREEILVLDDDPGYCGAPAVEPPSLSAAAAHREKVNGVRGPGGMIFEGGLSGGEPAVSQPPPRKARSHLLKVGASEPPPPDPTGAPPERGTLSKITAKLKLPFSSK